MQAGWDTSQDVEVFDLNNNIIRQGFKVGDIDGVNHEAAEDLCKIWPAEFPEIRFPITNASPAGFPVGALIRHACRTMLPHDPGTGGAMGWHNDLSYAILALIVGKYNPNLGGGYRDYCETNIFTPFIMGAGTPDHPEMSSHGTTVNRGFIVKPPSEDLWVIGDQDLNCTDAWNGDCNAGGCNLNPPLSNQKCVENGYMPFVGPAGWLIKASELADILGIFDSYGTWDQANKDEALSKKYFHDADTYYAYGQIVTRIASDGGFRYDGSHLGKQFGSMGGWRRYSESRNPDTCGTWIYTFQTNADNDNGVIRHDINLDHVIRSAVEGIKAKVEELDLDSFIKFWAQFEDYCPTLEWSRDDMHHSGPSFNYYDTTRWPLQYKEACWECDGDNWVKHQAPDGSQLYQGGFDPHPANGWIEGEKRCRANYNTVCDVCEDIEFRAGGDVQKWQTYVDGDNKPLFSNVFECRQAACVGGKIPQVVQVQVELPEDGGFIMVDQVVYLPPVPDCCGKCDLDTVRKRAGDVHAYREMEIHPSGFPNIDCEGNITDIRLFETVKDVTERDSLGRLVTYDPCQACEYKWDEHGSMGAPGPAPHWPDFYGTWGGDQGEGDVKIDMDEKGQKQSSAPDIRSDIMYRPARIPHFYDHPPKLRIKRPKQWPPPIVGGADWANYAATMGCDVGVIKPDSFDSSSFNSTAIGGSDQYGVPIEVRETWTGVAFVSGECDSDEIYGQSPLYRSNYDAWLDDSENELRTNMMIERTCADHTAPCGGFDHVISRDYDDAQLRYFGVSSTTWFGRTLGRGCDKRVTYNILPSGDVGW